MSQPLAVSSAICCRVALTSEVSVVHIDWTLIGAPPPTATVADVSCRVCLRGARTGGATWFAGMTGRALPGPVGMDVPRETGVAATRSSHPPRRAPTVVTGPGQPLRWMGLTMSA